MKFLVEKYFLLFVGVILAFAFFTRVYRVGEIKSYIFDEVYHAVTAKLIRQNDSRAFEWWNEPPEANTAVDWLHPPLAKYTQALGMAFFGETPFGWRISSVFFGTFVIGAIILLAEELFHNKRISVLAGLLASFDGLLLVQSRIAMNDIHVTFFILLSFLFYIKYRATSVIDAKYVTPIGSGVADFSLFKTSPKKHLLYLFLTGCSLGLALASKWSGFFALVTILSFELLSLLQQQKVYLSYLQDKKFLASRLKIISKSSYIGGIFQTARSPEVIRTMVKSTLTYIGKITAYLIIIPGFIYIISYWQMFAQGKTLVCEEDFVQQGACYCDQTSSWWVSGLKTGLPQGTATWEALEARGGCKRLISHFSELHTQIWWYQTTLKATHPYQSRPFQWFFDLRPVWMYVAYDQNTIANIYAQGNPILFWLGDISLIITIIYLIKNDFSEVTSSEPIISKDFVVTDLNYVPPLQPIRFLVVAYLMVWFPWQVSPRIMFFYHYTPAVPLLCLILSYWLVKSQNISYEISIGGIQFKLSRFILFGSVLLTALTFCLFYPNWTGIPVPTSFANSLYFFFPTWK